MMGNRVEIKLNKGFYFFTPFAIYAKNVGKKLSL